VTIAYCNRPHFRCLGYAKPKARRLPGNSNGLTAYEVRNSSPCLTILRLPPVVSRWQAQLAEQLLRRTDAATAPVTSRDSRSTRRHTAGGSIQTGAAMATRPDTSGTGQHSPCHVRSWQRPPLAADTRTRTGMGHQHASSPASSTHAAPPIPTGRGTNREPRRPTEAQPAASPCATLASRGRIDALLGFLRLRPD
jgi:hypothetical protein